MPQNGFEEPFSLIYVHYCASTATRATGQNHGFHDIDGSMARDVWTLGPEAHAAETVKQLPTQTSSQNHQYIHLDL